MSDPLPRITSVVFRSGSECEITLSNGRTGTITGVFAVDMERVIAEAFNSMHDNTKVQVILK